jgi:hypothetical protein
MGWWTTAGYHELYKEKTTVLGVFISVSDSPPPPQKIREQKSLKTHPVSFADEMYRDITIRDEAFRKP